MSFVVPAFNEEVGLRRTIGAMHEAAETLIGHDEIGDYEIIVVDDGSTDRTAEICDELAAEDRRVRVVHHPVNRTLGASLRSGFAAAEGDWVLYTDADLPFDLAELGTAFRLARQRNADVVSAYRLDRGGEGPRRWIYSYGYNALIRVRFGLRVRDVNFAAKLLRRRVLDVIELRSEGSFIDAELLVRADRAGFRIVQFGVDYHPRSRGVSTLSSFRVIRTILWELHVVGRTIPARRPPRG